MKIKKSIIFCLICLSFSSCATIFTPSTQKITVESNPPGAKIQINGIDKGVTPSTIEVKKKLLGAEVLLRMDGYETRVFKLSRSFEMVSIFNIFNGLGWTIDILTGKIMYYDETNYKIELDQKK